ncbi:MAG: hypothetical protein LBT32_01365, partial [Peptococcaceae bacterium]|nr:hypothetical protein [Peptococcaceae bacterium]
NIFSNSIKFCQKDVPPRITVSSRTSSEGNTYIFADNGVGFDMKYSGKLFSMFNRLHDQAEYEGSGIGLYTIKYIIEKHLGTVSIVSEVNHGCVIEFTLPK